MKWTNEKRKISELVPYIANPRQITEKQAKDLKASLAKFGLADPLVINTDNMIIGGHQRKKIIETLLSSDPDLLVDVRVPERELTIDEARELNVRLNKNVAEWDFDVLANNFELDDLTDWGFELNEIDSYYGGIDGVIIDDEGFGIIDALEKNIFVESGDLWTLGRHRLLCGDATSDEDVARLMGGRKADMVLTDPPYNVDYESSLGLKIVNDKMETSDFYQFLLKAFKSYYANLVDGGAFYCFHSDSEKANFFRACVDAGFHYSTTCIWVKNSLVFGRADYHQKHESVMYAFKNTKKHKWYSDRKQTTVWNFNRGQKNNLHPTMKPLDLLAYPIGNSSMKGDIILDTFGGSGSTLIASDHADRTCYMMEMDEKYASVILRRYAEYKGNDGVDITCERYGEVMAYSDLVKSAQY